MIIEKLGVTGPWTLGLGLTTLLLSKEIYVYNEEVGFKFSQVTYLCWSLQTIVAVTMFGVIGYLINKYGPEAGKFLDERSQVRSCTQKKNIILILLLQKILDIFESNKKAEMDNIEMQIAAQESYEKILTYRTDFFDILRVRDKVMYVLDFSCNTGERCNGERSQLSSTTARCTNCS